MKDRALERQSLVRTQGIEPRERRENSLIFS